MRIPILAENIAKYLKQIESLKNGLDSSPVHIVITDENANVLYANKAVEHNTGFTQQEIVGKNPADLWGGKMPKKFYEDMWRTIKIEKKAFTGEMQNVKKDGTSYWQELLVTPVLDEYGEVKFFIGMEPNITEKKKREEFREQFISAVGHQVRNPLITIRWVLEKLLASTALGESERQDLERAYRENQTLTDLVKDLLILSHIENAALESETIRLDEELTGTVESVQKKNPNVSFSFQNEVGPAPLATVKSLALQVFLNIIHNAAEHANKEHGEVVIKLQKFSQGILFSCFNNGDPIPEEFQPRIFSKVSSTSGGEGLGLFIVKLICDYLTWKVTFRTNEDGTTFYVIISWPNQ